ncbi:MAG: class I tRNA ligase family protein, partial [Patescibacteria group bacterium]
MDKVYNHKEIEDKIYKKWESSGSFKPETNPKGKPFTIILPPPNANAPLHFGHAMYVVEDILVRYHRMLGDASLWLPGADHAGFETQFVFEKELQKMGKSRFDYDRDTLYKMIWDFVEKNRGTMESQLKRLGFSLDWGRMKFTLDPKIVEVVYKTFKKMHDDGLVYRDLKLINYCTKDGTGFSDLEVKHTEQADPLYYMKYGPFVLATVRPETKFGDTAVAVHPEDKRYKKYIGQEIEFESLIGKIRLQVVGDEAVDPKFGTGVVKVTPAHDFTDFEIGKRHNLPMKQVIGFDGRLTDLAGKYAGLKVKEARAIVVKDLQEKGLMEKTDEKYTHAVASCYKCGRVLEPLPMEQWFVKVKPLVEPSIKALRDKKIKIVPKRFEKTMIQWFESFHDWNISRQLVWGIRIPAWKCDECGEWIVTEGKTPEKCAHCNSKKLTQDTDTFDTWFSSGQWPFATLQTTYGLPKMGFHEEVVPQVLDGKTKTYRLRDHGFKVGDKVLFVNSQSKKIFGYGIITESLETTIGEIDYKEKDHYKTYKSLEELTAAFKLRNPNDIVTEKSRAYVYSYVFHRLENELTDFEKFYPTSVMETAYDILPWWVARMVMLGIYATGKVPFETVYYHGLIRDAKGQKMSKSKGNVINPIEMVEKYSADAVRMALVFGAAAGNDQSLAEEKIRGMRNFTNKLWNIARFIEMNRDKNYESRIMNYAELGEFVKNENDKKMIDRVGELIGDTTRHIEKFELNLAAEGLYEFVWHQFADKYIEDFKNRIDENSFTILKSLFLIQLELLHPFMPFITEEVFGKFTGNM